jgi:hypothetical protein
VHSETIPLFGVLTCSHATQNLLTLTIKFYMACVEVMGSRGRLRSTSSVRKLRLSTEGCAMLQMRLSAPLQLLAAAPLRTMPFGQVATSGRDCWRGRAKWVEWAGRQISQRYASGPNCAQRRNGLEIWRQLILPCETNCDWQRWVSAQINGVNQCRSEAKVMPKQWA